VVKEKTNRISVSIIIKPICIRVMFITM
jgi:hypothetical protein